LNFQREILRLLDIEKKQRDEVTEMIQLTNPAIEAVSEFVTKAEGLLGKSRCDLCAKHPLYKVEICDEECETIHENFKF
jgi:hypothetical protein